MTDATVKKLGIRDRVIIPGLLPTEGGLVSQRVCKDIRKKVQFSQEEMKAINMRDAPMPGGGMGTTWDLTREVKDEDGTTRRERFDEPILEVSFTDAELKVIAGQINVLDKKQKINSEILETCEKFLDPPSEPEE
jgi:hypothetical protein